MNLLCNILNKRACAVANVRGSEKYSDIRGKVSFYNVNDGVLVRAEITGLPIKKPQMPKSDFRISYPQRFGMFRNSGRPVFKRMYAL